MFRRLPASAPFVTLLAGCAALTDADLRQAQDTRQPVYISRLTPAEPDRHGRIAASATIFNTSAKTYRYVDLTVTAHRRPDGSTGIGAPVSTVTLRLAGPLRPRRAAGLTTWRNVWQGERIACVEVVRIALSDMGDGITAIDGQALSGLLSRRLRRGCGSARNLSYPARKSRPSG